MDSPAACRCLGQTRTETFPMPSLHSQRVAGKSSSSGQNWERIPCGRNRQRSVGCYRDLHETKTRQEQRAPIVVLCALATQNNLETEGQRQRIPSTYAIGPWRQFTGSTSFGWLPPILLVPYRSASSAIQLRRALSLNRAIFQVADSNKVQRTEGHATTDLHASNTHGGL